MTTIFWSLKFNKQVVKPNYRAQLYYFFLGMLLGVENEAEERYCGLVAKPVSRLKIAIGSSSMVSNLLRVGAYSAVSSAPVPGKVELVAVA
jgi:hypothetical protein